MSQCQHVETEAGSGIWICPTCNHKALSSHAPKRECGKRDPQQPQQRQIATRSAPRVADETNQLGPCVHRGDVIEKGLICELCGLKGDLYDVHACSKHGQCSLKKRKHGLQSCLGCTDHCSPEKAKVEGFAIIPAQGGADPWRGVSEPKPWAYDVTAIIPVIEPDECLLLVIELLRLQTERAYILLMDTGSSAATCEWLEGLRAADLEVHYIRKHGAMHASELVSMAMDAAVAVSHSRFSFFTHGDCFLRKRTAVAELKDLAAQHVVAGHQITERPYEGWEREFGHTLLMVDQFELRERGISWNMQQFARGLGIDDYNNENLVPNFIDTERGFNIRLQANGIKGHFTGTEKNYQRNTDDWIDHVRSLSSSKILSPQYQKIALTWLPDAVKEARERIQEWRTKG